MSRGHVALVVALVDRRRRRASRAPLNSQLARSTGGLPATTIALGVSFAVAARSSPRSPGSSAASPTSASAPLYVIVGGGLVGALYVGSIVWTVRALGVGGLSAATLAGQFAAALVIDHFGWLGVDRSPITVVEARRRRAAGRGDLPDRLRLISAADPEEARDEAGERVHGSRVDRRGVGRPAGRPARRAVPARRDGRAGRRGRRRTTAR